MTNLIGISGKMQVGKTTAAKYIQKIDNNWTIRNFSDNIKEIASILTGLGKNGFEDKIVKSCTLGDNFHNITVRKLLQLIGT